MALIKFGNNEILIRRNTGCHLLQTAEVPLDACSSSQTSAADILFITWR